MSETLLFPSDAWIKALSQRLNESTPYELSAKNWEGDFSFVVEADQRYSDESYLYLALHHGKSPGASALTRLDEKDVGYTLSAPFSTWCKVIEGTLDPIQGMMTRQLKLKGNMMMIMRYPRAAKEIIECVKTIPTHYPE